jgi:hypothetical protein
MKIARGVGLFFFTIAICLSIPGLGWAPEDFTLHDLSLPGPMVVIEGKTITRSRLAVLTGRTKFKCCRTPRKFFTLTVPLPEKMQTSRTICGTFRLTVRDRQVRWLSKRGFLNGYKTSTVPQPRRFQTGR